MDKCSFESSVSRREQKCFVKTLNIVLSTEAELLEQDTLTQLHNLDTGLYSVYSKGESILEKVLRHVDVGDLQRKMKI